MCDGAYRLTDVSRADRLISIGLKRAANTFRLRRCGSSSSQSAALKECSRFASCVNSLNPVDSYSGHPFDNFSQKSEWVSNSKPLPKVPRWPALSASLSAPE